MSLLVLFQGGIGVDIPPPPPPPPVIAFDFLPHGMAEVGPGATLAVGPAGGTGIVEPAHTTDIGGGHSAGIGTGAKTTIQ